MSNAPEPLAPERSPWRTGVWAPLNVAAYITWFAVVLQSVPSPAQLLTSGPRIWTGLLALLLMLGLLLLRASTENRAVTDLRLTLLICGQGVATLIACYCLRNGVVGILLIIVAGQLFALFNTRIAVMLLLIFNVGLAWVWSNAIAVERLPLALLPMIGFQAFAALTARYAVMAERARDQLAVLNGELRATQSLLDASARTSERLKLSRELHDVAGHKLTALKLNLRVLQRDRELGERSEIQISAALADELLADIRAVVSELREHDGIELGEALRHFVSQIPGPRFVLDIDPLLRVASVQVAQTLLRCAQEAVTNALRHGQPSEIRVSATQDTHELQIMVADDGSTVERIEFGNGLKGMRERLREIGGSLQVSARGGTRRGVQLSVRVPLQQAAS
jgi:signal transduction histidine kinase